MKTSSSRRCRRCKEDFTVILKNQRVCFNCRKCCSGCGQILTKENWDSRGRKSGKQFRCKECVAKSVRNTPNRKEWQKDYDLKRNYGITLEDFERLSESGCRICGTKVGLVVDHCHTGGHVRGVLCSPCNVGLGMFKDSKELLEKAHEYLSKS